MRPAARIEQRLRALVAAGQWRDPAGGGGDIGAWAGSNAEVGGQQAVVDTRSNDYLGLARRQAAAVSRETEPGLTGDWGSGASRLISGTKAQHLRLEAELSGWLQAESCLLFSSGYAANVGVLSALAAPGDTVFSDSLNHASIVDGCRLGRSRVVVTPHRDLEALARGLRQAPSDGALWVVSESYFGMDGDSPDLRGLRQVCDEHQAGLIVDEAHALGIFGPEGRGLCAEADVVPDLLVGGMGKALGLHGGFVAGPALFRAWFWNRARSFVFSTAPSPVLCGVALDRLAQLRASEAERRQLRRNEERLEGQLVAQRIPLPAGRRGPIFPVVFGSEWATLDAARELRELGVICQPIRPPTVPSGGSRIRISLRADMAEAAVDAVAKAVITVWKRLAHRVEATYAGTGTRGWSSGVGSGAGAPLRAGAVPQEPSLGVGTDRGGWLERGEQDGAEPAGGRPLQGPAAVHARGASAGLAGCVESASPERADPVGLGPQRGEAIHLQTASVVPAGAAESALPESSRSFEVGLAGDGDGAGPRSAAGVLGRAETALPGTGTRVERSGRRWVILGTGTNVGKTFVSEGLVRLFAGQGRPVAGLKPVETGAQPGVSEGDASRLAAASFHVKQFPTPHPLYAFPDPVAPWLASRRQNRDIRLDAIARWIDQAAAESEGPLALVIETAGGVFSPLSGDTNNFDLALTLGTATWVLVAPDRLGVLHDVVSTLAAMQGLGRCPDWLVLSAPAHADASTGTNADELRRLGVKPAVISLERGQVAPLQLLFESQDPACAQDPGSARTH